METELQNLRTQVQDLQDKVYHLNDLFFRIFFIDKAVFQNPAYFNGKTYFKGDTDITKIIKTAGTAPIADGSKVVTIPVGGGSITITTKNGIITNIT
jgi:hypothetical protein